VKVIILKGVLIVLVLLISHVQFFVTPWTVCNLPDSSIHGISQERIASGLPFPSPGDLLSPGIEIASPALQVDSLPLSHREAL